MTPVFDATSSKFEDRLEDYIEAEDISHATKRRAVLVGSLQDLAIRVIQGRFHPRQINTLNYDGTVNYL
ncbi:hypothetical protein HPB52_021810 [Rhipicephalus sanguineus]|uniref:Uncharacterized protein n=1 Tax=Rhipicephalus sanguineus TaxID=34632 RepID=A0A9D4PK99_RHISA|nr:hypothetical protein HPB52_021810 [Rhipicephalus sanguineus]